MLRHASLALLAALLSSCSIMGHTPMTRFESPEVQGETLRVEGQIGYQGRNEISLTPDYTIKAPSLNQATVEVPDHNIYAQGAVGIGEIVDISISGPDNRIGAKVQLMGEPRYRAESGNFPLSIYGGYSWTKDNESGTGTLFGGTAQPYGYELKEQRYDIGLVVGYRLAPSILIYGGPSFIWNTMKGRYNVGATSGTEEGTARVYNGNIGIQANVYENGYLRLEAAGAITDLRGKSHGRGTWGAAAGCYF